MQVPVALLYNANVAFALASLGKMNIPMYNTMKRLTPALVLGHDYFLSGAGVSRKRPFLFLRCFHISRVAGVRIVCV